MRFGYFNTYYRSPGESAYACAQRSVTETIYAEALGYDDVWLAEAYFLGSIVFGASTLTNATYLAARTNRINIGTAVSLAPLHHPIETAIQAASIDQLSMGRFNLGVGRGISPSLGPAGYELQPPDGGRDKYYEWIKCVKGMLTGEPFNFEGEHYNFNNIIIYPEPYTKPHLPMWGVAQSADTFAKMGELGINLLIPIPGYHHGIETWEGTKKLLAEYRRTWKKAGHDGTPEVIMRIPTFIHETHEQGREVARRAFESLRGRFTSLVRESRSNLFKDNPQDAARILGHLGVDILLSNDHTIDESVDMLCIAGSPEDAVEEFGRIREEFDAGIMIEPQFHGQTLREDHIRTLRLIADHVMPHFK